MSETYQEFRTLRRRIMERDFSRMNDPQRQAVFHTDGPLLILAGARQRQKRRCWSTVSPALVKYGRAYDSGRCPVSLSDGGLATICGTALPARLDRWAAVACLAVDPCPAWRILAITFTNKAAGELKERLDRMLGEEGGEVAASTFHALCARILRRDGDRLGYSSHFTIYDTDDSRRLMKECMKALNIEEKALGTRRSCPKSAAPRTGCFPGGIGCPGGSGLPDQKGGGVHMRPIRNACGMPTQWISTICFAIPSPCFVKIPTSSSSISGAGAI